jgi:dolichol-phosphate mannosyltransferase
MQKELTVVLPIYNEEEIIRQVIDSWTLDLDHLGIDYELVAYDDGSRDNSLQILRNLEGLRPRLRVVAKPNSGHGPTILRGYRESEAEWVFQTDSDDEITSNSFALFWNEKDGRDLVIGIRVGRRSPLARRFISSISRATVHILFGAGVTDVNCPYRLYRREVFNRAFKEIGDDVFAPNVLLTGYAIKRGLRILQIPVLATPRSSGEVSIRRLSLLRAASRSWLQTFRFWLVMHCRDTLSKSFEFLNG